MGEVASDQENIYNLGKRFPLRMDVVGTLEPTGGPDDHVVFVDVKTAWVLAGKGHGHRNLRKRGGRWVRKREEGRIEARGGVPTYRKITSDNIDTFHFHGDRSEYPLTSVVVVPEGDKGRTILKNRYEQKDAYQVIVPRDAMAELVSLAIRVKRFFDATFVLVGVSAVLFLSLIVLLSLRLRARERTMLHKVGSGRGIVFWLQACELLILAGMSVALAGAVSVGLLWAAPQLFELL